MIVRHTKPFVTYISVDQVNIYLYPGNNTLTDEQAELVKESKDFQSKVAAGSLEIITNTGDALAPSAGVSPVKAAVKIAQKVTVGTMNVVNAVKTISGIFNRAELERLAQLDPRKGVQDAIKVQLEKIKTTEEEKASKTSVE